MQVPPVADLRRNRRHGHRQPCRLVGIHAAISRLAAAAMVPPDIATDDREGLDEAAAAPILSQRFTLLGARRQTNCGLRSKGWAARQPRGESATCQARSRNYYVLTGQRS